MGARRPQNVQEILEDLHGAVDVRGSLEIVKRHYRRDDGTPGEAWDWKKRPTITVRQEFRASERRLTLGEFKASEGEPVSSAQADRILEHVVALREEQAEFRARLDTWGWGIIDYFDAHRGGGPEDHDPVENEAAA
jgi:hypothetical protein